MSARWQVIGEQILRDRSCYLVGLKPRRWRWLALWLGRLYGWYTGVEIAVFRIADAKIILRFYENWQGKNRVYGHVESRQ